MIRRRRRHSVRRPRSAASRSLSQPYAVFVLRCSGSPLSPSCIMCATLSRPVTPQRLTATPVGAEFAAWLSGPPRLFLRPWGYLFLPLFFAPHSRSYGSIGAPLGMPPAEELTSRGWPRPSERSAFVCPIGVFMWSVGTIGALLTVWLLGFSHSFLLVRTSVRAPAGCNAICVSFSFHHTIQGILRAIRFPRRMLLRRRDILSLFCRPGSWRATPVCGVLTAFLRASAVLLILAHCSGLFESGGR